MQSTLKFPQVKKRENVAKATNMLVMASVQDDQEQVLIQFDLDATYGPALGMTRLARWERADRFGLNPPKNVYEILVKEQPDSVSVFEGRTV